SRHPHSTPQLFQDPLFALADGLLADAPLAGQVALAAAVPEEASDQAAVPLGEAVEGGLDPRARVCLRAGPGACRGGVVGDGGAGPGAAAVGPFLTVTGPDGVNDAGAAEGVEGDAATGVEVAAGLAVGQRALCPGLLIPVTLHPARGQLPRADPLPPPRPHHRPGRRLPPPEPLPPR